MILLVKYNLQKLDCLHCAIRLATSSPSYITAPNELSILAITINLFKIIIRMNLSLSSVELDIRFQPKKSCALA
jgi:hypothetical protein